MQNRSTLAPLLISYNVKRWLENTISIEIGIHFYQPPKTYDDNEIENYFPLKKKIENIR